ncbi:MAG: phosphoenolpyruvate carboxykinase (ATP), partial [Sphingobacteriaceae bacterium]|nr:phosphoenolpyruvate carboxykinase (ATP) [Cytophagaceae bacterium]
GVMIPTRCPGVPAELLDPRATWADKIAYDRQANSLAWAFRKNFQTYAQAVGPAVLRHAPESLWQD